MVKGITNLKYFAKGKHGVIYTGMYEGVKVSVKKKNPKTKAIDPIIKESGMLKKVNEVGIGPRFVCAGRGYVAYVFVPGIHFKEWMKSASSKQIKRALKNLLWQCYSLDKIGVTKEELTRPYKNVLFYRTPILIDFERAHFSEQPKNVTQFVQFLTTSKILKEKGIALLLSDVMPLVTGYKKTYEKKYVKEIDNLI